MFPSESPCRTELFYEIQCRHVRSPWQNELASLPLRFYSRIALNKSEPKPGLSSFRIRLAGTVFLATAPALIFLYVTRLPWAGFAIGVLALIAAWFGGERFVFRKVRQLVQAVERVGAGDLSARTGLGGESGEIGQLARAFDGMAATIEQRVREREQEEQRALNRALQQTAVPA